MTKNLLITSNIEVYHGKSDSYQNCIWFEKKNSSQTIGHCIFFFKVPHLRAIVISIESIYSKPSGRCFVYRYYFVDKQRKTKCGLSSLEIKQFSCLLIIMYRSNSTGNIPSNKRNLNSILNYSVHFPKLSLHIFSIFKKNCLPQRNFSRWIDLFDTYNNTMPCLLHLIVTHNILFSNF